MGLNEPMLVTLPIGFTPAQVCIARLRGLMYHSKQLISGLICVYVGPKGCISTPGNGGVTLDGGIHERTRNYPCQESP